MGNAHGLIDFDLTDEREAFIFKTIDNQEAAVIWRGDLPWHQGQKRKDRHVIGLVNSPFGPEIFMASARNSLGGLQGSVYMHALVSDVCRSGKPGGDVKAIELRGKGAYDEAVVLETIELGKIAYVGRMQTHGSAIYLLRVTQDFDGAERLLIATAKDELDWKYPKARVVWGMPFQDVIEMADKQFASPLFCVSNS